MSKPLEENYKFFTKELPNLLKDKEKIGKYVLIKDKKFIGFYDTVEDSMNSAINENKLKLGTFSVQKIEEQKSEIIFRAL